MYLYKIQSKYKNLKKKRYNLYLIIVGDPDVHVCGSDNYECIRDASTIGKHLWNIINYILWLLI